jgi:heme exporter protein B
MTSGFLKRECLLAYRNRGDVLNPVMFFVMVITLIPLGVSPDSQVLSMVAPGMLWVVALLASLLSLESLFRNDYEDGSLELLLVSGHSLFASVLVKVLVHWMMSGLLLSLVAPLLAMMLVFPSHAVPVLVLSLLLGTATFSLIGAIGSSLTVSMRRSGLLLSLIVLPLYIPVLIFGSSAVHNAVLGVSANGQLMLLGAILAFAVAFSPLAIIAGLRIGVDA